MYRLQRKGLRAPDKGIAFMLCAILPSHSEITYLSRVLAMLVVCAQVMKNK